MSRTKVFLPLPKIILFLTVCDDSCYVFFFFFLSTLRDLELLLSHGSLYQKHCISADQIASGRRHSLIVLKIFILGEHNRIIGL